MIPLLPRGETVFEGLPARAVILEAVAPSVGDGLIVLDDGDRCGAVVVRESRIAEAFAVGQDGVMLGDAAVQCFASWSTASVSASRLPVDSLDVVRCLLRGNDEYSALHLEWTSWQGLLEDLRSRDGLFSVEIETEQGRGVTCIRNGSHVATWSDAHPEPDAPSLLDEFAAAATGLIRVRSVRDGAASEEVAVHRDSADALTWFITQKVGDFAEETVFTAPFLFREEDEGEAGLVGALPGHRLRNRLRISRTAS